MARPIGVSGPDHRSPVCSALSPLGGQPFPHIAHLAARGDLALHIAPYTFAVATRHQPLLKNLVHLYADCLAGDRRATGMPVEDFQLSIQVPKLRRWLGRGYARFLYDGIEPFEPLPAAEASALFEWGANFAVGNVDHSALTLHAGVVERGGRAVVLSGESGAGKSTLTALLAYSGFRLLSDELCQIETDGRIRAHPRAISLKNKSILAAKARIPEALFSPVMQTQRKGEICHLRPPTEATTRATERADPGLIIFPKYTPGAGLQLEPVTPGEAFMRCRDQAFNFHVLGEDAYDRLLPMCQVAPAWNLTYDDTDAALRWLREQTESH